MAKKKHEPTLGISIRGQPGLAAYVEPILAPMVNGPAITAHGVTMPRGDILDASKESDPLVFDFALDDVARAKGLSAVSMIRDAVRKCAAGGTRPDASDVRWLARLVEDFQGIALRVPELCEYLGWLDLKGADKIIARLVGEHRRGRRRESYLFLIELVERIMAREQCSVRKAAEMVEKRYGSQINMGMRAIENRYSELVEVYRVAKGVQYVNGGDLIS